jgi:FkbM family methyltransferase
LEKQYGWTGILIEPSPCLYQKLCLNRPNSQCFCCALGTFEQDGTYIYGDFNGNLMSSVGGQRLVSKGLMQVPVRSLQAILDETNIHHINLFSLDTEGYEYNILKGIDFNKTTFDYLLIEIYNWDYEKICTLLSEKGYELEGLFSLYTYENSPGWDGTHNDYLFKRKTSG